MSSLKLGKISMLAERAGVTLVVHGDKDQRISLDPEDVLALGDFLRMHAPQERRVGFRVPFAPLPDQVLDAFRVSVRIGKHWRDAEAEDMSLTGILLRLRDVDARVGDRLGVDISLGRLHCTLEAVVVRRNNTMLALHFPSTLRNDELEPPQALIDIYRRIEVEWLKSRVE